MARKKKQQDLQPETIQVDTITTAAGSFEYWKNRINEAISNYEIDNNVSVHEIKKVQWNAVLIYIYIIMCLKRLQIRTTTAGKA